MGARDFYTDDEIRSMEAADTYRPLLAEKDRKIARLERTVKRLEKERDRLQLRLDDALDAVDARKAQVGT